VGGRSGRTLAAGAPAGLLRDPRVIEAYLGRGAHGSRDAI